MNKEPRQEAVRQVLEELWARLVEIREGEGKDVIALEELYKWLVSLDDANQQIGS